MKKEEKIKEAWIGLTGKNYSNTCQATGFLIEYSVNGIDDILNYYKIKKSQIDYNTDDSGEIVSWRPIELKGIENNHGWIKIESEDDLPKTECNVFFIMKSDPKYMIVGFFYTGQFGDQFFTDGPSCFKFHKVSHYQKINYPQPPIY